MARAELPRKARQHSANLTISCVILMMGTVLSTACNTEHEIDDGQVTSAIVQEVETTKAMEIATVDNPAEIPTEPFYQHTSQDAIDAFIAAGLGAENPAPLEVDGHSPLPPTFVEAQRFQIPALQGRSGRIFSFESLAELQMIRDYYEGFEGNQASIVIIRDNLLLQVSADLPAELADAYRAALETLQ